MKQVDINNQIVKLYRERHQRIEAFKKSVDAEQAEEIAELQSLCSEHGHIYATKAYSLGLLKCVVCGAQKAMEFASATNQYTAQQFTHFEA